MQFQLNFPFNFNFTYLQHPISFAAPELVAARGVPVHYRKSSSGNEGRATAPQKWTCHVKGVDAQPPMGRNCDMIDMLIWYTWGGGTKARNIVGECHVLALVPPWLLGSRARAKMITSSCWYSDTPFKTMTITCYNHFGVRVLWCSYNIHAEIHGQHLFHYFTIFHLQQSSKQHTVSSKMCAAISWKITHSNSNSNNNNNNDRSLNATGSRCSPGGEEQPQSVKQSFLQSYSG